jgi:SAM-dependent methyltransferase
MSEIDEARRLSFDARAALYDAVRPSYPDALADDLLATAGRRVLEIGAGTGKATVVFARRGASIVALEPGPSLAAVLRRNVAGHDVTIENTTFEAWPIARPFDLVMAAQAIHWVDPSVRYTKAAEVLAPGGVIAVIRNEMLPFEPGLRAELEVAYARWHSLEQPAERRSDRGRPARAGRRDRREPAIRRGGDPGVSVDHEPADGALSRPARYLLRSCRPRSGATRAAP